MLRAPLPACFRCFRRAASPGGAACVAQRRVDQIPSLLDATAHNSSHLDCTKGAHAGGQVRIAGALSSIGTLDRGFDERKAD